MTQTIAEASKRPNRTSDMRPDWIRGTALFLIVPFLIFAAFRLAEGYFTAQALERAAGPLSLYRGTVVAELERFSHLTFVLARDPHVIGTVQGGGTQTLNTRLKEFATRAGLDAIYLMDRNGQTIAASNFDSSASFVGQNYAFRPYFQTALSGQQGEFYGIGSTTGLPGYFFADPVRNIHGETLGVVAIKLDLTQLEESWRRSGETVFLANQDGVILLSSDPDWRYQTLKELSPGQRARISETRQFAAQKLPSLEWQTPGDDLARFNNETLLHLTTSDLPNGWELHYFAGTEQVKARSALATGVLVVLAAVFVIMTQYRRTAQIGAALRRSVAEEALLRQTNDRLASEIEERKATERRLARTQDELERASRLAALGQLAASVTHELGQPIAAMRNHLTAAEIGGGGRTGLTTRIGGLVDRMESITRQLKFFARGEDASLVEVDLRDVCTAALALIEPNIAATGTNARLNMPDTPVVVRGNQFRLEQVMTNLMRNAVDAMTESETRDLNVRLGRDERIGWCEISDTGPGLGDADLTTLQEPFFTTRGSGQGMGLGLAISTRIVEEHHGRMTAHDTPDKGAVFRVEIPLAAEGEDPDL